MPLFRSSLIDQTQSPKINRCRVLPASSLARTWLQPHAENHALLRLQVHIKPQSVWQASDPGFFQPFDPASWRDQPYAADAEGVKDLRTTAQGSHLPQQELMRGWSIPIIASPLQSSHCPASHHSCCHGDSCCIPNCPKGQSQQS